MRLQREITLLVVTGVLALGQTSQTAWGQFPGKLLDRIGNQAQQELRQQLQQAIPQIGDGWQRVKPQLPPPIIEPPVWPPRPPVCPGPVPRPPQPPQPPVFPTPYPPVAPPVTPLPPVPPVVPQPPTPSTNIPTPSGSLPVVTPGLVTPAGLIFPPGRLGHVMRHATNQPNRAGRHGVFQPSTQQQILNTIDEAFGLVLEGSPQVQIQTHGNGRKTYTIDLQRNVGYEGGKQGNGETLNHIKLVLEESYQVVTAFPARGVAQPSAIARSGKPGAIQAVQPVGNQPSIQPGQMVSINGQQYGAQPGTVTVSLGNQLELTADIISWKSGNIRARMPELPLTAGTPASVLVHDANRNLVDELQVNLIPAISTDADTRIQPESQPAEKPALVTSLKVAQPATAVEVGKVMSLSGQAFGDSLGRVRMVVGSMAFDTEVTDWQADRVTVQLPPIDLTAPVEGQLLVYRGDGTLVSDLAVQFTAPKSLDALVQIDQ